MIGESNLRHHPPTVVTGPKMRPQLPLGWGRSLLCVSVSINSGIMKRLGYARNGRSGQKRSPTQGGIDRAGRVGLRGDASLRAL
jgi:hypothetical protein